ncbi:MAG: tyrosine--tRNA ligase [Calditrichaeota bacterium]|nr:MAG: tyrosine--tRNA ligase [Calditrichota bacterium]
MFENVFDELKYRGFIEQSTDEDALRDLLGEKKVTSYIGFDPTADSLHVGNLVQILALYHMQKYGHHPIALIGGGTTMIGDPSGKTELRQMMTREKIESNSACIKKQIGKYIDFSGGGTATAVDNADWLLGLGYIEFLRDIGRNFSVNRMLAAESYKMRLETGLNFIEFNYQILQAYDYLELNRRYGCVLQMGGSDQWGNIVAGIDLVRRMEGNEVYALTTPLVTNSAGQKMGKTAQGAVWLDPDRFKPYDFYQYWINVDDQDVIRFMKLFTMLSPEEIAPFEAMQGADLRKAKQKLAYELTAFIHDKSSAEEAQSAAAALFGQGGAKEGAPETVLTDTELGDGMPITVLFAKVGLAPSSSEARRMIRGGGLYFKDERVSDERYLVTAADFKSGDVLLRAGKKRFHLVKISR